MAGSQDNLASQLWYQESQSIEQSRILTADEVRSGQMAPFAQTPLTPPGTDPALLGYSILFADQIPGFKTVGYLNGNFLNQ